MGHQLSFEDEGYRTAARRWRVGAAWALLVVGASIVLCGCGGLPATTEPTGAIVVFAAFDGPEADAPTIGAIAVVIIGGVRGLFNGPSERELILRNVPFGEQDPPQQPMTVTAPGYRTIAQQLTLRKDIATFVDLTMEEVSLTLTGTVAGEVRSVAGDAIVNALVTFSWDVEGERETLHGFTDSDGRFIIGGIPIGPVAVEAVASGFLPERQEIVVEADEGGTNADLSFSLLSGETRVNVGGVVRDLRTEAPLAGARVTVADHETVESGADGRFEVADVLVGERGISVRLDAYDSYDDVITVMPGMGDVVVVLSLTSSEPPVVPHTIAGTVTLLGRADNSGAVVTAFDRDRMRDMAQYTTGADGRYYLFVPAGRYEITVSCGGKSISRNLDYAGGGRIVDGIDFTLTP